MRIRACVDVVVVGVFLLLAMLIGAMMTPLVLNFGLFLKDVTSSKFISVPVNCLGGFAGQANYGDYYGLAFTMALCFLFFPLVLLLRLQRSMRSRMLRPWATPVSPQVMTDKLGQALVNPTRGWLQLVSGLGYGVTAVGGLVLAGHLMGVRTVSFLGDAQSIRMVVACVGILILSAAQEVFFRGVLMGIFLRAFHVVWAILLLSLLYAIVSGIRVDEGWQPVGHSVGAVSWELLSHCVSQLVSPTAGQMWALAGSFALGVVLALARYLTASLWLPIGLHAGWMLARYTVESMAVFTTHVEQIEHYRFISGGNLENGVLSVMALGLLCLVVWSGAKVWRDGTFWSPRVSGQ